MLRVFVLSLSVARNCFECNEKLFERRTSMGQYEVRHPADDETEDTEDMKEEQ